MATLLQLEDAVNSLISSGKILDALDQYFSDDCVFQEGNQPRRPGKAANRKHLEAFFATLKSFNGATLHSQGIGNDVTLSEWTFDLTGPEGPILWNEVLVRRWKNGKIVSERYYTAS